MCMYGLILLVLLAFAIPSCTDRSERIVETSSYGDVIALFNEIGFTAEQWQAGVREVPRIEITRIPRRWQEQAPHIPVLRHCIHETASQVGHCRLLSRRRRPATNS